MSDYDFINNRNNKDEHNQNHSSQHQGPYYTNHPNNQYTNYQNSSYNPPPTGGGGNGDGGSAGTGKPKRQKGFLGAVIATALVGAIAGSLVTGFVVMPMMTDNVLQQVNQSLATTTATEPAVEFSAGNADEQVTLPSTEDAQTGGGNAASSSIQDTANPVPEVVEKAEASVVNVVMYNKELISGQEPVETKLSSGTGFVISDDGYILTNAHVVSNGNLIKITTSTGEEYVAELVGKDSTSEVAVLKVEGLGLPGLAIGDSAGLKTGELVVAIGNPINDSLQNTVTVGYLSSTSRQITLDGNEMDMLQIDAAINPGNSGGPLLNADGEVIGINTSKSVFAGTDAYGNTISADGIGFSIPINNAMSVANQLIETGSVVRPGIGFTYSPISESDAELWQVPRGILIAEVLAGSPAQEAGLKVNDIITSLDGVDLTTTDDVPLFNDKNIGDTVSAVVWRDGAEYNVTFTISDLNKLAS